MTKTVGRVPGYWIALLIWLITSSISALVWASKLDSRVDVIERRIDEIDTRSMRRDSEIERRVNDMDDKGTRRLIIIEDRQNRVLERLRNTDMKIEHLEQILFGTKPFRPDAPP